LSLRETGATANMSRAPACVSEGRWVFSVQSSDKAVRFSTAKLISPELGDMVWGADR
jgi:molybdopterin biosynthesis enzyme MoaB